MFDWFGFDQTSKTALNAKYLSKAAESTQNKQEVSRTVIPTSLKLVFSGLTVVPLA